VRVVGWKKATPKRRSATAIHRMRRKGFLGSMVGVGGAFRRDMKGALGGRKGSIRPQMLGREGEGVEEGSRGGSRGGGKNNTRQWDEMTTSMR